MTLYIFVDIVFCCTLTFIYTFLFFLSKLLFMCHGMLMHPSHQMAGSSLLNKLMFPMQSREFGLEDMKHTYKFFTVLLLSVTADVTLSATCTPVSGCRATMEDDTNADSALFFKRGILETSLAKSIVLTSYSWFLAIVGHLSPSTCMSLDQVQGEVKLEWELTQEFGNCLIIL